MADDSVAEGGSTAGKVEGNAGVDGAEVSAETAVVVDVESDGVLFGCEGDVDLLDPLAIRSNNTDKTAFVTDDTVAEAV